MIVLNLLIAVLFYYVLPSFFLEKLTKPSKVKIIGIICVNNIVWFFIIGLVKIFLLNGADSSEYITPAYMIWGIICYWTTGKKVLKQYKVKQMTEEFTQAIRSETAHNPEQEPSATLTSKDDNGSANKGQAVHTHEASTTHQKVKVKVLQKRASDIAPVEDHLIETSITDTPQSVAASAEVYTTPVVYEEKITEPEVRPQPSPRSDNVNRLLILLSTLLGISLAGVLIWSISLSSQLKTINTSLETAQQELKTAETSLKKSNEESDEWKRKYEASRDLHFQIIPELTFYQEYAFIIPQGSDYYHTYDCVSSDLDYFIIANSANAEKMGFSPHSCIE